MNYIKQFVNYWITGLGLFAKFCLVLALYTLLFSIGGILGWIGIVLLTAFLIARFILFGLGFGQQ